MKFQIIVNILLVIAGLLLGFGYYYDSIPMMVGGVVLFLLGFVGNYKIIKQRKE